MKFNSDKLKGLMGLCSLLGVIGLTPIFSSDNFGTSLSDIWLAQYDFADTTEYQFRVKTNTNNFLVTGVILFGVGLVGFILSYYKQLSIKG